MLNVLFNQLILQHPFFENRIAQALVIFLGFFIISKIFIFLVEKIILRFTAKTKTKIDDLLIGAVRSPLTQMILVFGIYIGFIYLQINNTIGFVISSILFSALIILMFIIIRRVTKVLIDHYGHKWAKKTESTIDDAVLPLSKKIINVVLIIIAAIWVMRIWHFDITGVLAGVGIAGIAIGFAVKDSLSNIFGGISMLFDKSFQVGDMIEVETGVKGTVVDIGIRSTRLKTFDNELMIIPNGQLSNSRITNYNQPDLSARVVVDFGVEYGTKHEKVKKIVMDVISKLGNSLKDPEPVVVFVSMGDSALLFQAKFWVADINERYGTKEKATCMIYDALNKAKINIPFPTRTVYNKKG